MSIFDTKFNFQDKFMFQGVKVILFAPTLTAFAPHRFIANYRNFVRFYCEEYYILGCYAMYCEFLPNYTQMEAKIVPMLN
jgi:hypothetical protein